MCTRVTNLIDRRAIPPVGPDVHVYDFGTMAQAILFRDRLIECQRIFDTFEEAKSYGRSLADLNRCALIEHRRAA